MTVDAFTLAVLHGSLVAIARDMKIMTMRTAYTQLWKEQGDLSCCLMNGDGEIIAQDPNGFPIHVTTMPVQLQGAVAAIGRENLRPGDVLATNDPFIGGTHLPDVLIARPVFHRGKLYAYACNRGHWADIGGMGPGSYSPATSDIHQEGIFIPPVKLFEAGRPNRGVLEMIMSNIRNRSIGLGDLRAQYASCETAERRLDTLVARYGFDTLRAAMTSIIARAERMTRARIADFPDGDYHARDCLDGDGRSEDRTWVDVRITIRGSDIVADLRDSSDQSSGGMNCSHSAAASAVQYAIKSITDPENPPNAGSYSPITVVTRPGSLVDARKPGSMVGFGEVCYRVLDATMAAIAGAIGDRAIASGSGSTGTAVIAGRRQVTGDGDYFTTIELSSGAYGARATRDGLNAIRYGPGNAGHIPIEADEMENPLFFEAYEIVPDTGGAGRFRGGNGFVRAFRVEAEGAQLCLCADRHETPPPGLFGGQPGATARYVLNPGSDRERILSSKPPYVDLGNGFVRAFRVEAEGAQLCLCADRHDTPPPGLFGGQPGATARYVLNPGSDRERILSSKTPYVDLEPGTLVHVQSAGGGGYGDPRERDPALIARDLKNGYVTEAGARVAYGDPPAAELRASARRT